MRRRWTTAIAAVLALGAGACDSPTGPDVESEAWLGVVAGLRHACALAADGSASCWGDNERGQLGNGTRNASAVPVPVSGGLTFTVLDASDHGTCGLTSDGSAYCWGRNDAGQAGTGVQTDALVPTQVLGGPFARLSVGSYLACGLTPAGALYCWGADRYDAVLAGESAVCPAPYAAPFWRCATVPGLRSDVGALTDVSVGAFHVCGLRPSGAAVCWGMNRFGQLGAPSRQECHGGVPTTGDVVACTLQPAEVSGPPMTSVSSAASHTCGLTGAGQAYCWGALFFNYGQLGTGDLSGSDVPAPVAGGLRFTRVETSAVNLIFTFTCGLDTDGRAHCWGAGEDGQLGAPPASECNGVSCSPTPTAVDADLRFADLALGGGFACGVASDEQVYCWGRNDIGQLGRGQAGPASVNPQPVRFPGA